MLRGNSFQNIIGTVSTPCSVLVDQWTKLIATAGVIDGAVLWPTSMMRVPSNTPKFGFQLYSIARAKMSASLERDCSWMLGGFCWASHSGAWIIEDDYDSEYRFEISPIASLQGLDSDARVIYIGTFSKVLFPSLRLGYLIIPLDLVPAFSAARGASEIFSPTLFQAVLTDFIREGHFARHVRGMRALYADRRNALVEAIRE